ncbi:MAG: hypothetical protein J6C78_05640 [Muribaculaceae bacterium]|nr:hypothetical protein [Muribaculaceae bacterium]
MKAPDYFFISDNEVWLLDELDYSRVSEYVNVVEAFSLHQSERLYHRLQILHFEEE